jgi:DEAD/DEAH box helicase domain-containing protein
MAPPSFGPVRVNKQPKLYKKIRERTYENIGYGPITLPAFEYETTGFSLLPPRAWRDALGEIDKRFRDAALFGLSYLLRHAAPCLAMADLRDIETDVSLQEEEALRWKSSLYLYDAHEGGVGYAEKIFELLPDALLLCRRIIDECPCPAGCPACVPPLPPGVNSEELEALLIESNAAVACTRSLLDALLDGRITLPEVRVLHSPRHPAVEPPEPDPDTIRLGQRLDRAAHILDRKRRKLH